MTVSKFLRVVQPRRTNDAVSELQREIYLKISQIKKKVSDFSYQEILHYTAENNSPPLHTPTVTISIHND